MSRLWRVEHVEARLEPFRWAWAEENRDLVAAHWRSRWSPGASVFNGRVLMVSRLSEGSGALRASFFETDYASMIAWIAHGFPGEPVWNGFAMGALRCRDGGFLLGRMAEHTANAGRLYFPCGTPDRSDVRPDGTVDLEGSILREIAEETGLGPDSYRLGRHWLLAEDRGYLAFLREGRLELASAEARDRVRAHLAAETRPELAEVLIVSGPEEVDDDAMPGVVTAFLRDAFATGLRPGDRGPPQSSS